MRERTYDDGVRRPGDAPVDVRAPVDLRPLARAEAGARTIGYLGPVLLGAAAIADAGARRARLTVLSAPGQLR